MPELPEVEVLARHLAPLVRGRRVQDILILKRRVVRAGSPARFRSTLRGTRIRAVKRRGKYLLFHVCRRRKADRAVLVAHLGMTGRIYVAPTRHPVPVHAAAVLKLTGGNLIFEDPRGFGRLALGLESIPPLGPEPLDCEFTPRQLAEELRRSRQAVKVKLLDQAVVAGIGNIYASEALFRARIHPSTRSNSLRSKRIQILWNAIRQTLIEAIRFGSTVPLAFHGTDKADRMFYFGSPPEQQGRFEERLKVYGREGEPCRCCKSRIRRISQGGRSTFFCPRCQHRGR